MTTPKHISKLTSLWLATITTIGLVGCGVPNSTEIPLKKSVERYVELEVIEYEQTDLNNLIGETIGFMQVANEKTATAGFLSYGPYIKLEPGKYEVTYEISSAASNDTSVGFWDITHGTEPLEIFKGDVFGTNGEKLTLKSSFTTDRELLDFQVRVFFNGKDDLAVGKLIITSFEL